MSKGLVIGFSGKIASGKTALSTYVAEQLGWPRVSFGDYVRSVAQQKGLGLDRNVLQDLGAKLLKSDPYSFCRSVLCEADWSPGQSLIVDGIRHYEIINHIKTIIAPSQFCLVVVATSEFERHARLRSRASYDLKIQNTIESHSTEFDVNNTLPMHADLIVDGTEEINNIVGQIISHFSI